MRKILAICLAMFSLVCMLPAEVVSAAGSSTEKVSSLEFVFDEAPAVGKKIVLPKLVAVNGDTALLDAVDIGDSYWAESEVALSFATFAKVKKGATFEKGKAYKLLLNADLTAGLQYAATCTVSVCTPTGTLTGIGTTTAYNKKYEIMLNFGAPTNYITVNKYEIKLHGFSVGNETSNLTADIYVNGKKRSEKPLKMNVDSMGISTNSNPNTLTFIYDTIKEKKQYYLTILIDEIPNHIMQYDDLSKFTVNGVKAFKKVAYTDWYGTRYMLCFKLPVLHKHTYVRKYSKATMTANGKQYMACSVCGWVASNSTTTIKKIQSVKLSCSAYTYNGKTKTPTVTVKDSAGNKISSAYYTVKYSTGRKNVGKYKVTVTFKGKYTGTKTLYFNINPARTTVSKLVAGRKSVKVYITRRSSQVTGYQIQYSTSKSFKSAAVKTVSSYKTTTATLSKLSAKKTYYVRVRTYKTVGGVKYYSGWSTYKYKKTK